MNFFEKLLSTSDYMPHGNCYLWDPAVLWLNVLSDLGITLAYFSIPIALVYFVRQRRDLTFKWMFWMFGAFIFLCGMTHLIEVYTVWEAMYRFQGTVKLATAGISLATAVLLWPLVPKALALPSPADLSAKNEELLEEVVRRRTSEADLLVLKEDLERRVRERTEEIHRSNEELEQFARVVSHDFQEPLRMVASYMQLLQKRNSEDLDEESQAYIGYAVDGAQHMSEMLKDLLAYSRVSRGEAPRSEVDLGGTCSRALRTLSRNIEKAGAQVEVGGLPSVVGSDPLLTQVFQNLLSNALKYRSEQPCRIRISSERENDRWIVTVRDNGIGVDPAQTERIFLPFQRGHSRSRYPGTGMGLAIVKRVVELHGGGVWVESKPGEGAAFHFWLPAAAPARGEGPYGNGDRA